MNNSKVLNGVEIRNYRVQHGFMTQRELAEKVGLHPKTICWIERGYTDSYKNRVKITEYFKELNQNGGKEDE